MRRQPQRPAGRLLVLERHDLFNDELNIEHEDFRTLGQAGIRRRRRVCILVVVPFGHVRDWCSVILRGGRAYCFVLLWLIPTDVDDESVVEDGTGTKEDPALEAGWPLLIKRSVLRFDEEPLLDGSVVDP